MLKKEKKGLDTKLTGFQSASKGLDNLIGSQRSDKNKKGLGYSVVPPPPAQVYSHPKNDMSWTGLPEFADDTIIDYTRPSPNIESNPNDLQNNSSPISEIGESTISILSKHEIKFVKTADSPTVVKQIKMKLLGSLLLNMLKCIEKLQRVLMLGSSKSHQDPSISWLYIKLSSETINVFGRFHLPVIFWDCQGVQGGGKRKGDKDRAAAMIQAIDKMLKTRRIMRSLERFLEEDCMRETFGCCKGPYESLYVAPIF
nr:hypothetical protein [Tanacetum cinerariifolium]